MPEQHQIVLDSLSFATLDPPTVPFFPEMSEISESSEAFSVDDLGDETVHHTLMTLPTAIINQRRESIFERQRTTKHTPIGGQVAVRQTGEQTAVGPPPVAPMPRPTSTNPFNDRYNMGELLGQGGGGRVFRAYDRVLGRQVAMKILRSEAQRDNTTLQRFVVEAQTTGRLAHPNIMPIYDFGSLPTGEVFYTMREVRNQSLRSVIQALGRAEEEAEEEYSTLRLVIILQQVCQAVHYAHAQGVVHRDLKPDNIMLGEYGEVLVVDWGLAREMDNVEFSTSHNSGERHTLGTPAYMPPEQARGELDIVDQQSDVYSIGAILYEMLTLTPPYQAESPLEIMWQVVDGELTPPSIRTPQRDIPEELEQICLRAMAFAKHARFPTAKALHDALADWIAGIKPREASERVIEGQAWSQRYRMLRDEILSLNVRVKQCAESFKGWEDISQKRELWLLEDEQKRATLESAEAFGLAVANYTQALAFDPKHQDAKRGLTDIYWMRFLQAEEEEDITSAVYFKALVRRYDEAMRYVNRLRVDVGLNIQPAIPMQNADATLIPLEESHRRLELGAAQPLGPLPCRVEGISAGRYLLQVKWRGEVLKYPLLVERGQDLDVVVRPPQKACQPGFAFVPGGQYISGGDAQAFAPRAKHIVHVDGFFVSIYPVTFREYLTWLDELQGQNPQEAMRRAPQLRGSDGMLARLDQSTGRWVPNDILIEGPLRKLYPIGEGYEWDIPVVGVCYEDALHYVQWRSQLDGIHYKLPTEHQLEKAGRGVDGRLFPWGDHFDPTFCRMRFSRQELPQLEPVGTFDDDVSPYGVRDLAGGVQEWCSVDELASTMPVMGGSWTQDQRACHLASRIRVLAISRSASTGFRLAYEDD